MVQSSAQSIFPSPQYLLSESTQMHDYTMVLKQPHDVATAGTVVLKCTRRFYVVGQRDTDVPPQATGRQATIHNSTRSRSRHRRSIAGVLHRNTITRYYRYEMQGIK